MHKATFQIGELLDVEIEKLTFGGNGLARHQNVVIFVPYSAPGDQLKVRTTEIHKNYLIAEIETLIHPSPYRQPPQCTVYGKCGGCNWQHIAYEEQLKQKCQIVREQILSSGHQNFEFLPAVESPRQTHYRNRVQLKFDGKNLGFFARKTHDVLSSESCILMEDALFRKHLDLAAELKKQGLSERSSHLELSLDSNGFTQVNRFVNELLQKELVDWISKYDFQYFFDLYAGGGNFTFPIVSQFKKIKAVGVELNEASIHAARKITSEKTNVHFFLSDVEKYLRRTEIPDKSIVLIDPPRTGCSEFVVQTLARSRAQALFYISCDPSRLSRDLKRFLEFGWKTKKVRIFDMFPQTHHVETLIELIH